MGSSAKAMAHWTALRAKYPKLLMYDRYMKMNFKYGIGEWMEREDCKKALKLADACLAEIGALLKEIG